MPATTPDHAAKDHSSAHAYWMARAAQLAYKDEATIEAETAAWGFSKMRFHEVELGESLTLSDAQAYTVASDRMIISAFRGTEPRQIRDWLSDVNTPPWPGPGGRGLIHYGFGEALNAIYPKVRDAIGEFQDSDQSIWFTGHSLGGALAHLAGIRSFFEAPQLQADGVYTFGAPRSCDRMLALAHDQDFRGRTHRFVNNNDIVPTLPPEPAYHHVEALHYIDAGGTLRDSMPLLGKLGDRARGLTADMFSPASDGIRDHSMERYVAALEKNLD